LINSTYAIIIANLARPIGPFDEIKELAAYKKSLEVQESTPNEES